MQASQSAGEAAAGYAVVLQDCRGRGKSEGVWDPFRYDVEDGYDTQEWVGTASLVRREYRHVRRFVCGLDAMGARGQGAAGI